MRSINITMRETVKVAHKKFIQGASYESWDMASKKLFQELVIQELADETTREAVNGTDSIP